MPLKRMSAPLRSCLVGRALKAADNLRLREVLQEYSDAVKKSGTKKTNRKT